VLSLAFIRTVRRHQLNTSGEQTAGFKEINHSRERPLCQRVRQCISHEQPAALIAKRLLVTRSGNIDG